MKKTLQLLTILLAMAAITGCDKYFDPEVERDRTERENKGGERYCADLKEKIAKTRKGSDEYKRLMAQYKEKCGGDEKEKDEVNCDELARKLKSTRKGTDEYKRLIAQYEKHCKKDEKEEDYCAGLKKKMSKVRKGSDEYNKLMRLYKAKCGNKD